MALTDTKKAKEFMAGAPDIKLKGDLRPKQDMQMASMDENEREFMRLVEEFMEQGFSQQQAIEEARETLEKKFGIEKLYGVPTVLVIDQDEAVLNSPFIEDWTTARTKKPEDLTDYLSRWIEG